MNRDDCDIDVYRLTKPHQVGVLGATATHRPTGITASVSHYGSSKETTEAVLKALTEKVEP